MINRFRPWIAVILSGIMLSFLSCSLRDDERALTEMVEKAASMAERHEFGGIMDLATEDFRAYPGDLDRRGAKKVLFMAFRYYGELRIIHPQPSIDLEAADDFASMMVPFLIVRKDQPLPELKDLYKKPKEWLERAGEHADLYRFKLKAVKAGGEWLVKEAYLERFTGLGFNP
ncbi:MAG: hypothetical protein JXA35_06995 [Deltaproteobacteria bacterium]|nr:hypothetical protein [Deltaproteobacteria bacterium]